ncbi:OmpA family protein [Malonomonas rubra]|uniref:OmpA family protein n=1 Tax=Malonomonas rubra TaxID=57040 RepID=UPI0026EF8FCA|nr:OmpA family protein [Malonomonas rubra]
MINRLALAILFVLLLSTPIWAGNLPGAFSVSTMFGEHIFDNDQNFDNSTYFSLGLGYNLTDRATLEAVYGLTKAEGENAGDTDSKVRTLRLDALYHFQPDNALVPYLAIGGGEINSNPEVGSSTRHLFGNIGGGIKYFINDVIALRGDVRYLLDLTDWEPESENNLIYSGGLLVQFGAPAPAPVPVMVEEQVATPEPEPVPEPAPTPAPAPAPAPVPPKDSDGDGVIDSMDICPNTQAGVPVDNVGCPLDSDGDGVYDYLDKCPETPAGVSVDADGCPTRLTLKINFGLNSDQIGPEYDGEIAKAAQCIESYPGNLVYIDGHTDNLGPDEYNWRLSERRAKAVKNRLVEKFNIPAKRLTARGFGESEPVADNATKEGRFENRRVEVLCGATE